MITELKSCVNCNDKIKCDAFKDKIEITISGYNKNRLALGCSDYNDGGKIKNE